jgi:hypothetical protein
MTMITLSALGHAAFYRITARGHRVFSAALNQVRQVQEQLLRRQLTAGMVTEHGRQLGLRPDMGLAGFQQAAPITDYTDWCDLVERQRSTGARVLTDQHCKRYQPTSGSTSAVKWIPYNPRFLKQIDCAVEPWVHDLYTCEPRIRRGRHYWSLSWVPTSRRAHMDANISDDTALMPWSKRLFLSATHAVPPWVAYTPGSLDSLFAGLCYLSACEDLSLISVWSPTFALNLLEALSEHREQVAQSLHSADWGSRRQAMGKQRCPENKRAAAMLRAWDGVLEPAFFQRLWPHLGLISAWDTSTSAQWAARLRQLLPHARFQGKGLWATEGVVTIPFQGVHVLAVRSHFYEFRDLGNGETVPAWLLEKGQQVQPVLTTGNGFLRYALRDRLRVSGFLGGCPMFTFMGRLEGIDMVGEKLGPEEVERAMAGIAESGARPITLFGIPSGDIHHRPFYLLLCEGVSTDAGEIQMAARLEGVLRNHFHYELARDLGQLGPVRCMVSERAREIYAYRAEQRGMVAGDMKIDPLVLWDCELHPLLQSHTDEGMAA